MNESVKPRFAIDLDEIERQLAEAQASPQHASQTHVRNDPLAELARIVGQEDPFRSMLATDQPTRLRPNGRAPAREPAGADDLFAGRPEAAAELRGSFASDAAPGHAAEAGEFDPN